MTTPENKPETPPTPHMGLRATKKAAAAERRKAAAKNNVTPINRPKPGPAKKTPAKKEPAKAPAKKAAAKSTAAPKPIRDAEHPWYSKSGYKAQAGMELYEATSESGQISVRSFGTPMTHAVSWAQPERPGGEVLRKGRIHTFHPDEESAQKVVDKINEPPDRAVIVPVIKYRGQPGDPK